MIQIEIKYEVGQMVFLKTDPEQLPMFVTSIVLTQKDVTYRLTCGQETTEHQEFEISDSQYYINYHHN